MKKFFLLSIMAVFATSIMAGGLYTSIADIYYQGENELTGSITFEIDSDEYAAASPTNPIYLRLSVPGSVELSKSRANHKRGPINLALRVYGAEDAMMNAPADAVSIVRWRKGESAIWIKITASSSTWLLRDGVAAAPSDDARVTFTIGVTGRDSRLDNRPSYLSGQANLPANSRAHGKKASTLIFVDVSEAGLTTTGIDSLLGMDIIAFDSLTEGVETVRNPENIIYGNLLPVDFYGDFWIARGVDEE